MDPDAVSKAFVEHYYSTFDTNRSGLANLYQESSMLTFEGQKIQGSQNIVNKLTSLPSSSANIPSPPSIASHPDLPAVCSSLSAAISNSPANNMLLSSVRMVHNSILFPMDEAL
ncbi:hypothetical protein E3N88_43582 [Mikania micrantha]|uniref:NTF2 domain-containing protein n=1 Tax=Mikania micrantha TaxID=192012 RepID=A0A5N6LEI3_9ASTR|nr:hypothetical protein E3N88_43582 [Mikania micrantha]